MRFTSTTENVDVVVVGSGAAGLSAALRAAQLGASVLVLERADTLGGTSARGHGYGWFPNNRWMRAEGVEDPKSDAMRYMARLTAPHSYDPDEKTLGLPANQHAAIAAFYDHAPEAIDSIVAAGVRFAPVDIPDHYGHLAENKAPRGRCLQPRTHSGAPGWGSDTVEQLSAALDRHGGRVLLKHRATELLCDAASAVVGVQAVTIDGPITIGARRGVVFASGGFSQDRALCAELTAGPTFGSCAAYDTTGDFLRIATDLGIPVRGTAYPWMCPVVLERALRNAPDFQATYTPPGDSMLYVNRHGQRAMDEKAPYNEATQCFWHWDPARLEWPDLFQFMIWDQSCQDRYASEVPANPIAPPGRDDGHIVSGSTLTEVAAALLARARKLEPRVRVPLEPGFVAALRATVAHFNANAARGCDPDFHRGELDIVREMNSWFGSDAESKTGNALMRPLSDSGPYYATIMAPGMLDTKGGPLTDARCRVLDGYQRPVTRLYGAGNCVASHSGKAYWAPGATIGAAITFGYIAGSEVAAEPTRHLPAELRSRC